MLGLSYSVPSNSTYTTVDYALYSWNGNYEIFENGTQQPFVQSPGSVQGGDIFRIERNSGFIIYRINGIKIGQTFESNPGALMFVEIAMLMQGSIVRNLVKGCCCLSCYEGLLPISSEQNSTVLANGDLEKTSGAAGWTTGSVGQGQSTLSIEKNQYIEWEITGLSFANDQRGIMLGLSYTIPLNSTWNTVDYAMYYWGNNYQIFENGATTTNLSNIVQTGDILRIERNSGYIIYRINGVIVRQLFESNSNSPMFVEIAMYQQGSVVRNLVKGCVDGPIGIGDPSFLIPNATSQPFSRDVNLEIYPNPASQKVIFSLENRKKDFGNIEILDITGRLIQKIEVNDNSNLIEVDVSDLIVGVYLCRYSEDGFTFKTYKLIKK